MSTIIGDPDTIRAAESLPVGSPMSLVNWDVFSALPEMFSGHVVSVEFKPPVNDKDSGDFEPVGGGVFMPSIDLMNKIGDKRGIIGDEFGVSEPIMMDIDWNRMTCQFDKPPQMVRYHVGYRSTKQGKVLTEDGSERPCDPCTVEYNAWTRVCADMFGKEESATDYYSPAKVKTDSNGSRYYESTWNNETSKRYLKYDTRAKRQAAFDTEMKFAMRKADSKARALVVRVICGMQTGYTLKELSGGVFYFYKITRSEFSVKAEQAARLTALSNGIENDTASRALFGPKKTHGDDIVNVSPVATVSPVAPVATAAPAVDCPDPRTPAENETEPATDVASIAVAAAEPVSQRLELARVLSVYKGMNLIDAETLVTADKMTTWLSTNENAEKDTVFWPKALSVLDTIEKGVPVDMRISGNIKKNNA